MCLDIGISPSLFYESTLGEIYDLMRSYRRREGHKQKEKIVLNYMLAFQIGERIASLLDSNSKVTPVWDMYPELFEKEKELNDIESKKAEMELYKAKFTAFAHNRNLK